MKVNWIKIFLGAALGLIAVIGILTYKRYQYLKSDRFVVDNEVRSVLENSDKFVLLSLRGAEFVDGPKLSRFHGFDILGQKEIADSKVRANLINALYSGMNPNAPQYSCFSPEHGIRATHGEHVVDVVVCFGCGNVDFYDNGKKYRHLPISREPLKLFEQAVKEAHLNTDQLG